MPIITSCYNYEIMSDHKKTIVPLESWCYKSPELRFKGKLIDIGLFAEALIYYDQVIINFSTQAQFIEFLNWFVVQGKYPELIRLLNDQTIVIYYYAFTTPALLQANNTYALVNLSDSFQRSTSNSFEQQFFEDQQLKKFLKTESHKNQLINAIKNKIIEVKPEEFNTAIENANLDVMNPERMKLLLQAFVDETYPLIGWTKAPSVEFSTKKLTDQKTILTYNLDFKQISKNLGDNLQFHDGTPLVGLAIANRLLLSAAYLNCDLYLGRPISSLVGDKLYESCYRFTKSKDLIQNLQVDVEFPDIRSLINARQLKFQDIMTIRKKAVKFRKWLQDESERDRNAIIAYHNELAKETNLIKYGRKSLRLFGNFLGSGASAYITSHVQDIAGITAGVTAGLGFPYLFNIISKIGENWKPVIFGDWLKERIVKAMDKADKHDF